MMPSNARNTVHGSELHLEISVPAREWNPLDLKIAHVCSGRAFPKPGGHPGKLVRLSFSHDLDAAIRLVRDDAVDPQSARLVDGRVSESDPLDTADRYSPEGLQPSLPIIVLRIIDSSSA